MVSMGFSLVVTLSGGTGSYPGPIQNPTPDTLSKFHPCCHPLSIGGYG